MTNIEYIFPSSFNCCVFLYKGISMPHVYITIFTDCLGVVPIRLQKVFLPLNFCSNDFDKISYYAVSGHKKDHWAKSCV